MAIKKITETEIQEIEKGTAKTLPDNPSQRGYSPAVIKKRLSQAHRKVLEKVNDKIEEINEEIENIEVESIGEQLQISEEVPTDPSVEVWIKITGHIDL